MLFPESAKKTIAQTFYDKTVEVLSSNTTLDEEGGAVRNAAIVASTFKGNVRFTNLAEIQESMGLTRKIDIAITCATDTAVAVDDLLQYQGVKYVVVSAVPSDSHLTITGERWQGQ